MAQIKGIWSFFMRRKALEAEEKGKAKGGDGVAGCLFKIRLK